MPFKKGKSGNPGGRPKVTAAVRELARDHGAKAIERLVELMASENERTAVAACEAVLNRGYGRPAQALTLSGEEDKPAVQLEGTVRFVRAD